MSVASPWIVSRQGVERPLRLFCFAYAGGHAGVYVPWQVALEPLVEICGVQLPGRGARMLESAWTEFAPTVEQIVRAIAETDDGRPFAYFGHSLGALLAFETARLGAYLGHTAPAHLFLSGCEPAAYRPPGKALHLLSDAALIEELREFNGTPLEVLRSSELMALLLPPLRADFALVHGYRYQRGPRLGVPITVLAGCRDRHGSGVDVGLWSEETDADCEVRWFDGDHFFINSHQHAVLDCVRDAMSGLMPVIT